MVKVVLKSIDPIRTALAVGIIYFILGLIAGILSVAGLSAVADLIGAGGFGAGLTGVGGWILLLFFPVVGFIGAFVATAILALIYNLVARFIVTIKLDMEEEEEAAEEAAEEEKA